jgi:Arc/MetJ-type ribon-helix-helix transcriptional regulator
MKFSANIPDDLLQFLDSQVRQGHYRSRSHALTDALHSWRTQKLEADYAAAFAEADSAWDATISDGLLDEQTP